MNKYLDASNDIRRIIGLFSEGEPVDLYYLNDICNDLCDMEEEFKQGVNFKRAFEIIKEKKVNVENFVNTCFKMSYEQYKFMWEEGCFMGVKMTSKEYLTQEEFNLLKEVLV